MMITLTIQEVTTKRGNTLYNLIDEAGKLRLTVGDREYAEWNVKFFGDDW